MIICRHCNATLPTKNQNYQHVICGRCEAGYAVAVTELRASNKTTAELEHLRIKNS